MSLQSRFHQSLLQTGCIPAGSRLLVAVSGGSDSVALLHLLHSLADELRLHVEAAHLDHALRDASRDDVCFVKQLCGSLGVHVTVAREEVSNLARQSNGNLEEVARNVRRKFLEETAKKRDCRLIVLGHHADDQAETFLMRLMRGAGTTGLAGMRLLDGLLVRPLLPFHRDEIRAYLIERSLAWREDESNQDQTLTRNRIRHQLLPLMANFNPNISTRLAGLCRQLRQDEDFWDDLARQTLDEIGRREADCYSLAREALADMPPALASRVVRAALHDVRGDLRGVTATHLGDVLRLVGEGPPQCDLSLPGAWMACRYDKLLLYRSMPPEIPYEELTLTGAGSYPLPDGRALTLSLTDHVAGESADAVEFDATSLTFPLLLRSCLPGDHFQPSGMSGRKKLQDFFVDRKLTREERRKTLLMLANDEVLWVVGLRRCEGWRPCPGRPVLRIEVGPLK